jgi:hypothetical protein
VTIRDEIERAGRRYGVKRGNLVLRTRKIKLDAPRPFTE